jgi:hypothetical protein
MSIYGVTEDEELEVAPAKRKKIISEQKMRTKQISSNRIELKPPKPKPKPEELATNVVDISEEDIKQFSETLEKLTSEYIDILKTDIVPHMAALDAAIDYVQALLSDGVGRSDISSDTSIQTAQKWILLGHFINRISEKYDIAKNEHVNEKLAALMLAELAKVNPATGVSTGNGIVGIVSSMKQQLEQRRNQAQQRKA